jgi:hypothetical protein
MQYSNLRLHGCLLQWVFFGCVTLHGQSPDYFSDPDESVKVVMALYGGIHDSKAEYVDVSDKVTKLLQASPQGFDVSPEVLLDKAAPNFSRTLLLIYNFEQRRYFYNMPDHGAGISSDKLIRLTKVHPSHILAIPPTSGSDTDFHVQFATYGVGDTFWDSTDKVNQLLRENPEGFFAHENVMGGDPHWGSAKAIVIIFDTNSERHFFTQINLDPQISKEVLLYSANPK